MSVDSNNSKQRGRLMSVTEPPRDQELPRNLAHKPFYALHYQKFDGPYPEHTDARWLSLGLSQWDSHDVSLKVLRYDTKNKKWSRQSEELPLHRVIDAAIWVALVLLQRSAGGIQVKAGTFQGQNEDVEARTAIVDAREQRLFDEYFSKFGSHLEERFRVLSGILATLPAK